MKKHPLIAYFVLAFAITWGLAIIFLLFPEQMAISGPMDWHNPIFWLAVFSPSLSAIIVTVVTEGIAGVLRLFRRLVHWRFGLEYYAFVLVGLPLLGALTGALNGSLQAFTLGAALTHIASDPGPLGEELGWRGFALPRLLERFAPLQASLILGVIWGVWHLPSFAFSGMGQSGLVLPIFLLGALAVSVLAAWLFCTTGGSVLITILMHMMVNMTSTTIVGSFEMYMLALVVLTAVVLLLTRGLRTAQREIARYPASGR